jgi:uncharacterized protein (TIGR02231 family)
MKKITVFLTFIVLSTVLSAQIEKKVKTSVQKAIVYQQGAQLFSTEFVSLPTGTSEVIFENVSPNLDPNSLQASSKGDGIVIDVRYNVKYAEAEKILDKSIPDGTMKRYQKDQKLVLDSLQELVFWQQELNIKSQALQLERNVLNNNKMMQGNFQRDSLAMFIKSMEFLRNRIAEMDADILKIARNQHQLQTIKTNLEQRYNDIAMLMSGTKKPTDNTPQPVPQIIVTMMAETAMTSEISINYFINDAAWTPSYDLRASKESPLIELKHRASVVQNSGLDWKNVSLVLSTGNPNQSNERPTLNPFFVGFVQPIYADASGKDGKNKISQSQLYGTPNNLANSNLQVASGNFGIDGVNTPAAPNDEAAQGFNERDLNEFVSVENNLLRVEYDIALKYNIESDGRPRNVIIQSKSIPTTYTYSVVPKLDPDVFLMARITDWEDMNLVPGEARVYFDNSFIGTSFINPRNTNDTMQLNFGRDKSIVVNRTKVKDKCKEKFMNDNKFSEKTYEITIRNTKNSPIRLIIEDQMPVAKDPSIKIEYTETGNATRFNPETGKLTWDLNIKSKDSKKLTFSYEVKHPKDKMVSVF